MTELVAGLHVGKNVRLVRALAQGGMGAVWIADHLGLGTQVAVKFMTAAVAENAQSVQRFSSEATAAARIKSPHVVQVFDHGISDFGMPYIVMELLDGEDLAKRVERLGPLSLAETSKIISQSCTALAKAHALGIVHRDLKPENIFLIDSGGELFVKVLDFGIAKQTGDVAHGVTSTGMIVGTPSYMSPEQMLSAKHLDHRSDIWSLGVVAYHCLTGQVPFHGESFGALAVAIHQSVFSPPSSLRGNLPPGVDAWFARAMARAPEDRFGSAKEMADAFALLGTSGSWNDRTSMQSYPGMAPPPGSYAPPAPASIMRGTVPSAQVTAPTFDGASFTQTPKPRNTGLVVLAIVGVIFAAFGAGVFIFLAGSRSKHDATSAAVTSTTATASATPPPVASATNAPTADTTAAQPPTVTPLATAPTQVEPSKKPGVPGHGPHPTVTPAPPAAVIPVPVAVAVPVPVAPPPPPPPPSPKVPDRGF